MKNAGCQVFAVDHQANRFTPKVPTFTIDLSLEDEVTVANQMLEFVKPDAVHFGLMCGTCSRAREHQVSKELRKQGAPTPQPLRDEAHLFGRPGLSPTDKLKVDKANTIYKHAITLLLTCYMLQCIVSIENPARSWLWPLLAILVKQTANEGFINWYFSLEATMFDACMHGSSRNKSTTILGSPGVFNALAVRCDHSHSHEPWSAKKLDDRGWVFDTAAEAEYPAILARRMAACILQKLASGPTFLNLKQLRLDSLQAQGRQHRALQQLVPDFEAFHWLPVDAKPAANEKLLPPKTAGEELEVAATTQSEGCGLKVGVWMEPEAHIARALLLHHPMDTTIVLPDPLKKALFAMLTKEPAALARERLEMLKLYRDRAADLRVAEAELHKKLPSHVQGVVQGKRLLLFEERLKANSFPDMRVMSDFLEGVDLVGEEPVSELFKEKLQPASMTVGQLDLSAPMHRRLTINRPLAEHEREHADRLVELSQEEVEEQFLKGPFFSEEEVSTELGTTCWTLTKRFLLVQGDEGKERIIDDYRRSHVNSAFASRSYLELQDVDVLAALITLLMRLLREGPKIAIQLSDGTVLHGRLSRAARSGEAILGRCFDLSKAYKQLAVSVASLKYSVLGARDRSGKWYYYIGQSLPFGSTASVYSLNKMARALQFLLWEDFGVLTTNFYDDYPTLEFAMAAENTTQVVCGFFQLLGWRHAVTGKKAKPFSPTFAALGVEYNLTGIHGSFFTVGNKPERLARMERMVQQVAQEGRVSSAAAASIHGLLNFASGFALGKALQPAAQGFSTLAMGVTLQPATLASLCEHTLMVLKSLQPRKVSSADILQPIIIYTDGAFGDGLADWGAILLDVATGTRTCYSGIVPSF